jgi:hypothetical protein
VVGRRWADRRPRASTVDRDRDRDRDRDHDHDHDRDRDRVHRPRTSTGMAATRVLVPASGCHSGRRSESKRHLGRGFARSALVTGRGS